MAKPFCYIAHKGEYWAGVCTADHTKEAGKFVKEFIDDGFTITPIATREEYVAKIGSMKMWHESPDYKPGDDK